MITRKVISLSGVKHHPFQEENFLSEILDLNKVKNSAKKGFENGLHFVIWISLKSYIISVNYLNTQRKAIILKIKEKIHKHKKTDSRLSNEPQDPSKYLNLISEYRHKIKIMKRRIKQEEGIE